MRDAEDGRRMAHNPATTGNCLRMPVWDRDEGATTSRKNGWRRITRGMFPSRRRSTCTDSTAHCTGDTRRAGIIRRLGPRTGPRSMPYGSPQCRPRTRRPGPRRGRRDRPHIRGMARARSGQAPAWPLASDRSVRRGSRVKRDFACTLTSYFSPIPVALRSQSRLRLEGRTHTLSGPSPDLSPTTTLAPDGPGGNVPGTVRA
jgi:hypothetical protein